MSRRLRLGLAVVALALAAALAQLARDVHRWHDAIADDDVGFLVQPLNERLWSGPGGLSGGLARRLLGVDDDLRFRRAERLYVRAHVPSSTYGLEQQRLTAEGTAVALLDAIVAKDGIPERRARAATLLGVVAFEDAQSDPESQRELLRKALLSFRLAARSDEGTDDAKADLELLLMLLRSQDPLGRDPTGNEGSSGGVGAGLNTAGGGY